MRKIVLLIIVVLVSINGLRAQSEGWAICNSGANLYFKIVGSGTPVLVVGDAGNSSNYLRELVQNLCATNRVVYYDPRATGKSRLPVVHDSTVNFQKAVADIEALRMVLRIPKWSIVAHGYGTHIACAYASQAGSHLSALVVINPSAPNQNVTYGNISEEYGFSSLLTQEMIASRFGLLQEKLRKEILPNDTLARAKAIATFQAATYVHDTLHEPVVADFIYEKVKNQDIRKRISGIFVTKSADCVRALRLRNIPVMVVLSRQRFNLSGLANYWKTSLPNAEIAVVDRAHHFPWLDNPAAFYEHVYPFLGRVLPEPTHVKKEISRSDRRGYQRRKRY
jgi:proline iminopeptidase